MKVVSLVPSWTEMLISSGVNVVGRTRFCIHPQNQVQNIPIVGGTKDIQLEKLASLSADLIILDQEENLAFMKEQSPIPALVTHVTSLATVAQEIQNMSEVLKSSQLESLSQRWLKIAQAPLAWNWQKIPGEIEVIAKDFTKYEYLVYVIWRNPWMSVSSQTFIGSVLSHLGAGEMILPAESKYPQFQLTDYDLEKTYFLFSSEPFPFHKKMDELRKLGIQGSVVDGESYSWFGLRSLNFLEKVYSSATN